MIIEGYQAKDGTNKGVGRNLVLADGRRLFLGGETNSPNRKPGGTITTNFPTDAIRRPRRAV